MQSPSQHVFSQVPSADIPRSSFDRTHGYKTTFDSGFLVPVFLDEVLPGDSFSLKMSAFARMATPIHPIMDNIYLDTFFFFVPIACSGQTGNVSMAHRLPPAPQLTFSSLK